MIKPSEVLTEMMETLAECKTSLALAGRQYTEASLVHLMTVVITLRHIEKARLVLDPDQAFSGTCPTCGQKYMGKPQ